MSGDPRELDAEVAAARAELEEQLAAVDVDLSDPSLWEMPAADLEDRIVATATVVDDTTVVPLRPRSRAWVAALGAAAVIVALAAVVLSRGPAPDWRVPIEGTDLAPLAGGAIDGWNEDAGTRVRLDLVGLPPAPDGYFYELWFSEGPIHVSAGTFQSTDGVELWTAVRRADYPRLWITLEPIDDDESPSTATVLDTG
jgi:hypothetical protein